MIPPGALVVLDTNVILALVRGKALGERIDRDLERAGLRGSPDVSMAS